jgi:Cof subfamily protein (haloacid dehalogenase superfamily)
MPKYKLIASDVDGTLTADGTTVSNRVKHAIESLKAGGQLFTLSTGRNLLGLKGFTPLVSSGVPIITYHGSVITTTDGETLYESCLTAEGTRRILELGWDRSNAVMLWCKGVMYSNKMTPELKTLERFCGESAVIINSLDELRGIEASKVIWIDDAQSVRSHIAFLDGVETAGFSYYTSHPFFLEFVPAGITKGHALRKLAERLGIGMEEIIAVGDGMNDMTMVEYAGLGAAMGNAPDELKAVAGYIAPDCFNDGLADVIEKFML